MKLSQASCVVGRSILKHSEAGTKMDLSVSVKYAEDESRVLTAKGLCSRLPIQSKGHLSAGLQALAGGFNILQHN